YSCTNGRVISAIASATIRTYFSNDWAASNKPLYIYQTHGSGVSRPVLGKYNQDGSTYDIPLNGVTSLYAVGANESGSVFYVTVNNTIYAFGHGSDAKLVMNNTSLTIQKSAVVLDYNPPPPLEWRGLQPCQSLA